VTVTGPAGAPVTARYAVHGGTAVIEAAQACGLTLLPPDRLAPLDATSRGVGELIAHAAAGGAARIVLGVGGVATTDGGAGLVQALGGRLAGGDGAVPPGGGGLGRLASVDLSGLADLSGVEFLLASDVDNPLLGPKGAAAVYGPQKGASPEQVTLLEAGLRRWADAAEAATGGHGTRDAPGAGAAGGLGFAAQLFLGARMRPGIELLLELAGFESKLAGARLVITGEGSLDAQTLHGKAPAGVARAAGGCEPPVPVVAVAGRCLLTDDELRGAGIARAYALTGIEPDVARCLAEAGPLLERLAGQIAADWLG
jgi:glycerate 2-kinase